MSVDKTEIVALTEEYGEAWGLKHTERLLELTLLIGEGRAYDVEAVWLAAHLHDWGGYAAWARPGVDHALRSAEVAEEFLAARACPHDRLALVLEAILTHHSAGPGRSLEATLLSDADALDFLGSVGVLRTFSMMPRDLRSAYDKVRRRREQLPHLLQLPRSLELAGPRLAVMDEMLASFERESCGRF